jgi:hypothetical protein
VRDELSDSDIKLARKSNYTTDNSQMQQSTYAPQSREAEYCILLTGDRIAPRLGALFDVIAQFGYRTKTQCTLRQLRLDRSVRIERIGHAIDHA